MLAAAFADDPAMRYLFPDAAGRPVRLQRFFDLMVRISPDPALTDLALDADGRPAAAAVWRRPGAWQTSTLTMVRHAPALLTTFGLALPRALGVQARLDAHHPRKPHWYLQFFGCRPELQGKGYGGAALRYRLDRVDAEGLPAALETATESNLGLYRALGFDITDAFDGAPDLPFWDMWREPRTPA